MRKRAVNRPILRRLRGPIRGRPAAAIGIIAVAKCESSPVGRAQARGERATRAVARCGAVGDDESQRRHVRMQGNWLIQSKIVP